jgi:hypothetical protein
MWLAYYDHHFLKLFTLLLRLVRSKFQFNWLLGLRVAYYSAVAAIDFRKNKGNENYTRVKMNLIKFFKAISQHSIESFNYEKAAELELRWWDMHRYPQKYDKDLALALAEAMATVYNSEPSNFIEYGRYRMQAMLLRDDAGEIKKIPPDWPKIESLLLLSWQCGYEAAQKGS